MSAKKIASQAFVITVVFITPHIGAAQETASPARAARAPVIDGRDDDEAWRTATPITGFRLFDPTEDAEPAFRTEARIAYTDWHWSGA